MTNHTHSNDNRGVSQALDEFRLLTDVSLARIEGRLDLLVQRAEHADRLTTSQTESNRQWRDSYERLLSAHADMISKLDDRVDIIERVSVTREDLEKRSQRMIATIGLIVSGSSVLISAVVSILIAAFTK